MGVQRFDSPPPSLFVSHHAGSFDRVEIRYSYHAKQVKMPQRAITEEEVEAVISSPEFVTPAYTPPGRDLRKNLWRRVEGRLLRVTIADAEDLSMVVTVVAPEEEEERE